MTLGPALALGAVALATGAAAIRSRDAFWAFLSIVVIAGMAYRIDRGGLDTSRFVTTSDAFLAMLGVLLFALVVVVTQCLPKSFEDRLLYGSRSGVRAFERALLASRQPFVDAARAGDDSTADKARWRASLTAKPPTMAWALLVQRLAAGDEEWAANARRGSTWEAWLAWQARSDQVMAEWKAVRRETLGDAVDRARWLGRLARGGYVASGVLALAGVLGVTNGLFSTPPSGRAAVVPPVPPGRTLHLVPLGDFPTADLVALADFYAERYGIRAEVLPAAPVPASASAASGRQLVAEPLIDVLRSTYRESNQANAVVIGYTDADIQIAARPDWGWAFGWRDGPLAVLSRARMSAPGPFGDRLESTRLRKMTTKYIGVLYFGLPQSNEPSSVMYGNILGVGDLDGMGEDF